FYDFINRYRVSDFVEKLKNKEHHEHTLLSLAYDVGFNSKTTFNKAFKKTMDHTPTAYLNKLNRG
ncbi:MAG: helix-turn-helix domain-containing protein, partial [Bacteroidota bacterium]